MEHATIRSTEGRRMCVICMREFEYGAFIHEDCTGKTPEEAKEAICVHPEGMTYCSWCNQSKEAKEDVECGMCQRYDCKKCFPLKMDKVAALELLFPMAVAQIKQAAYDKGLEDGKAKLIKMIDEL